MKRLMDIIFSTLGLLILAPLILPTMFLVWWNDGHSPLYIATRVGRKEVPFQMVKLRSMVVNADRTGVDSTGSNDMRITKVGHFIRRFKLDELTQLWNVLKGDMSLVGPRPNVKRETDLYTIAEKRLLLVRPGITDFASIVFSDEGDILKDKLDPDVSYNQLIRPWKGYLGLFYIDNHTILLDICLCIITIISILSRPLALRLITSSLRFLGADKDLVEISTRNRDLVPTPPPGSSEIVVSR